ncbi:hypothetical protein B0T11DRAFT_290405 [Plectosphaerella cucumerina]|uniref:Uncharacterized protein n=1 Tax=Plectosphaerella cucumerina TaxID=40658 RepID=A0A8K0TCP4_9PEZI|nr:hypothetical protein B0T11DRAFT_290405 [Plectosphaerella cucumerina]
MSVSADAFAVAMCWGKRLRKVTTPGMRAMPPTNRRVDGDVPRVRMTVFIAGWWRCRLGGWMSWKDNRREVLASLSYSVLTSVCVWSCTGAEALTGSCETSVACCLQARPRVLFGVLPSFYIPSQDGSRVMARLAGAMGLSLSSDTRLGVLGSHAASNAICGLRILEPGHTGGPTEPGLFESHQPRPPLLIIQTTRSAGDQPSDDLRCSSQGIRLTRSVPITIISSFPTSREST